MTTGIHYNINFTRLNQHLVDVTLTFSSDKNQPKVWLPSWLAGSYLMREFSRHITAVHYHITDDTGNLQTYRADKMNKNEWQLSQANVGDKVTVMYEVYCYDLSVRAAYVDQNRIFGNFSSLALAVSGQEEQNISVSLNVANEFYQSKHNVKIASGLPITETQNSDSHSFSMQAVSYDELIDYPFEIAEQSEFSFTTQDNQDKEITHRFFISGRHGFNDGINQSVNSKRLQTDVQKICQTYNTWLGDTPFSNYTFMTFASGNDYGGLEHINSTALVIPRDDLPSFHEHNEPSESYQRYLGLCSHEYFHAWWVKTVRPDVMIGVDFRKEAYTPLLWVFEGFTSYIDDFMLQASGVINKNSYLTLLTTQIDRYNQTVGKDLQTVAESSFDAWIKLYRSDENTGNAGISYYNKGALVALCLDLILAKHSNGNYRIFDVVKRFYELAKENDNNRIGMTNDNLTTIITSFIDAEIWQEFYNSYVVGLEPLPFYELLADNGVDVSKINIANNVQPWGIVATEGVGGVTVNKVNRDSVASTGGLSANDVIVAINGIKASRKQLVNVARQQNVLKNSVTCHAFRRDELIELTIPAKIASDISSCASLNKVRLDFNLDKVEQSKQWLGALVGR